MNHLIYVSTATQEMTEADLIYLLEQSRKRNLRQHVTGMLLYVDGNFIQVLEGDKKDIDEIYTAIANDDRNQGNFVIEARAISERSFPDWSMGFNHLTKEKKNDIAGYTNFLSEAMTPEQIASNPDDAVSLLFKFKDTNI